MRGRHEDVLVAIYPRIERLQVLQYFHLEELARHANIDRDKHDSVRVRRAGLFKYERPESRSAKLRLSTASAETGRQAEWRESSNWHLEKVLV